MTTEQKPSAVAVQPPELTGINIQAGGFMPAFRTFDEVYRWCDLISRSTMVPKAYQNKPADIMVSIQFGTEVGLKWLQSLQSIAVVNGQPSLYGDSVLGLVRASGLLEEFDEWIEVEGVRQAGSFPIQRLADEGKSIISYCMSKRKGMTHARTTSYSVDDAKRAKLWEKKKVYPNGDVVESPWCTTPQRMLMFRSRGWNLRDNFGDVLKGMPIYEEVMDIDDTPRNLTEVIATASQPETKGVQVGEQLAKVATERGVEVVAQQVQPTQTETKAQEPTPEPPKEPAQEVATEPAKPTPSAQTLQDDQQIILNAIDLAEQFLKSDEAGMKKYGLVLGNMRIRLVGQQKPIDVLPVEQRVFYLGQLTKMVDSLKEKKAPKSS